MDVVSLIRRKRAGLELSADAITDLVRGAVAGEVPDYQISAWLMAVCYEHLSYSETLALTRAFVDSGTTLHWPAGAPLVDKHSTGGVGDKVSLLLMPWLAAVGLRAPKMSGRSLGHTGGTIDKLECIPGFRTALSADEFRRVLADVGCVIGGQSAELAPADKLFYALRDATDTVDEMGLIAASVMSKKVAAGAQYIVLDVKCGHGAFFTDLTHAREFANLALRLGAEFGRQVACVISEMSQPLGHCVGNALEVQEALDFVEGRGVSADLHELCCTLGAALLVMAGVVKGPQQGAARMEEARLDGSLAAKLKQWIAAQGGDVDAFRRGLAQDADHETINVTCQSSGWIAELDALAIGELARSLGEHEVAQASLLADQVRQAQWLASPRSLDPLVGVECLKKVSDRVEAGEGLALIRVRRDTDAIAIATQYQRAVRISPEPVPLPLVVLDIIGV